MVKKALVSFILVFLLVSLIKNISEYNKNSKFYTSNKLALEKEQKRNNILKMEAIKQADPRELEKTIRNNLNYLRPNEIAIIVPTPTSIPVTPTPTPQPVYRQWVNVFFK